MPNNDKRFNIQERSYSFAIDVVKLTKKFPKGNESFVVANQLVRSATSIPANLYEGSASVSKKEFIKFVSISKKSAVETCFWLRLCKDLSLAEEDEAAELLDESNQIVKILSKIILNAGFK